MRQKQLPKHKTTIKKQDVPSGKVSRNPTGLGAATSARCGRSIKYQLNYLPIMMRYYLLYTMTHREPSELNREIKCEKCGNYEGLEIHHNKYYPKETVTIDDIKLYCNKCHRNDNNSQSAIKTIFKNGKRFCVGSWFRFEYIFIFLFLLAQPVYPQPIPQPTINIQTIITIESGGNPNAYNEKSGCIGIMQINPNGALADWNKEGSYRCGKSDCVFSPYNIGDLYNPTINVMIGSWYLKKRIPFMLEHYNIPDTTEYRLIAFNWGIGHLKTWYREGAEWEKLPKETRQYIEKYKKEARNDLP